jgi:hypothetical protein
LSITEDGKVHIKRFMAGWTPSIARSIAYGIGEASPDGKTLGFEVGRADINITAYDFSEDVLVFKANLPLDLYGTLYELALYSVDSNSVVGQWGSRNLSLIDSINETWKKGADDSGSTYFEGNSRINSDALLQNPGAGVTMFDYLNNINLDLSGYSGADQFRVAYFIGNANGTASLAVRLLTDSSNYYTLTWSDEDEAGYHIKSIDKASASVTGTPDWSNINSIQLRTVGAGAIANVQWDGIRIEDYDTLNPDYVMVAYQSLTESFLKESGKENEVEYAIQVNI